MYYESLVSSSQESGSPSGGGTICHASCPQYSPIWLIDVEVDQENNLHALLNLSGRFESVIPQFVQGSVWGTSVEFLDCMMIASRRSKWWFSTILISSNPKTSVCESFSLVRFKCASLFSVSCDSFMWISVNQHRSKRASVEFQCCSSSRGSGIHLFPAFSLVCLCYI